MYAIGLCWSGRGAANLNAAATAPPISNSLRQAAAARQQQAHKLRAAIQRSFDGLRSARNVAACLIAGGGAGAGDSGRGGGSGKDGGNPRGDDGSSGDPWIETLENTSARRHEEESTSAAAADDDDDADGSGSVEQQYMGISNLDPTTKYLCSNVKVVNMEEDSEGTWVEEQEEEGGAAYVRLGITPGEWIGKEDVKEALLRLEATGWYKSVKGLWSKPPGDGIALTVMVKDVHYTAAVAFQCMNVGPGYGNPVGNDEGNDQELAWSVGTPCLFPKSMEIHMTKMLQMSAKLSARMLSTIQETVEGWYHSHGYPYAKVKSFGGLGTKKLQCHVVEGKITRLVLLCEDDSGEPTNCCTRKEVILRELPLAVTEGMQYNVDAGKAALHSLEQLGLFDKIRLLPSFDPEYADRGGVLLHILVREHPCQSVSLKGEWSFLAKESGWPNLRTLQPGGSVCVQQRNIAGLDRTVSATVATSNLWQPEDDVHFRLEYVHPYMGSTQNPYNHTLRVGAFSKRKLSAMFADGESSDTSPGVWIDRAGIKANITENISKQSKLMYGLVLEEVATKDEASTIYRHRPHGFSDMNSAESRVGSSGFEHVAFLQMKITRSNGQSGNTGHVGARDIFQVDQGLGWGTWVPLFNRHQLAMTRFLPLGSTTMHPPPVVVLHTRYGGCIGDVPSYRSFTSGGPYSLRGHNTGELANHSRFLEVSGELRVPVHQLEVYCFCESVTSLVNFRDAWEDPRHFYARVGKGILYGAGVKIGDIRTEYVVDCNEQTGSFKVYFGDARF